MKTQLLVLLLCFCATQVFFAQEDDGVVSLNLPVRNSLTFNRYAINPTFSFVREQNKYISIYNKREWVQFDDAPLTYLASYNGRFAENIGAGIGLFQQNYGVLSTFGGVLNFAYNARLTRESNLTFGLNIGAYKSGINTANVVTNFDDPSLQNVPDNFLITVSPGINFGLEFFDLGVSINNLAVYNFKSSTLIEDNPEQGIQAHIMYTGYMNSSGFFDESKFSGLVRSEFKKDQTIVSAITMLNIPKGIWAQVGYNSVYGVSGGLGLNITEQFAIEYNYEKALGDLTDFGPSHDITLAYRFKSNETYDYSSGDEVSGLISLDKKRKPSELKLSKAEVEARRELAEEKRAQEQSKQLAEQKAKEEAEAQAKLLAEQQAKVDAEAKATLLAEQKVKDEAQAQEKLLAEQKAKEAADAQAILLAEQKAKEEAAAREKRIADQKAQEAADARAKLLAEQKAKQEADKKAKEAADARAKLLAEQKAKVEAEAQAQANLLAEQKAQEAAAGQTKLLAERKAKEEAEAQAILLEEQKAKEEADAQAKLLAEQKAKEELITNPKDALGKAMLALTQQAEDSKARQDELFKKIDDITEIKNQDLRDLKEENDLSDQGITVEPKPFKSIAEENNRLMALISDLENSIQIRNQQIGDLKSLFDDNYAVGTVYLDEIYVYYKKTIDRLTAEQIDATQAKILLELRLKDIQVATEFEQNRRIKRAAFDNEGERYSNDRATLQNIKQTNPLGDQTFKTEDFDFGEEQSSNIQILKNIDRVDNGYYLIIAVHNDIEKRNDFVSKVVASGRYDVDYFYDVQTSKYYIYYDKFDSIEVANQALKTKGNRPYNTKMSLMKIEN